MSEVKEIPFEVTARLEEEAEKILQRYPASVRSASLPLLHLVQEHYGYVSGDAIRWVAQKLELEPINILELVTFYPGFRQRPAGKHHIRVCRTLSCALAGSQELMDKICELKKIDRSQCDAHKNPIAVSPDGKFSVEFAECLASCGTGPVCLIGDDFHEGVAPEKVEALLRKYE